MEDYIFLLIAIALSIFGAINQSKKKRAAENTSKEEVKPRNFFMDQILGEDFLAETEPEPEETIIPAPVKQFIPKVAVQQNSDVNIHTDRNFHLQKFKSTLPDRPKHVTIKTTQQRNEKMEEDESEETTNYLEDFSLRKAFVYSQILEQKY